MKFLRNDSQLEQQLRELGRDQTDAEKVFRAQARNRHSWDSEVLLDMQGVLNKLFLKVTPPNLPFAKGEG